MGQIQVQYQVSRQSEAGEKEKIAVSNIYRLLFIAGSGYGKGAAFAAPFFAAFTGRRAPAY